ncbi:D-2-hydroxyacid dehydrogenase [Burkholderia aenigmatica]|uniref:2-hydroxyacid dehydrogenase n=1 Tax=Burkholderia cepacia complex TaxID=87882 RepID=UPI000F089E94|nr:MULTISPECIES: 2-hydroxyacid dehydrogenase [Burkholderia cepacia complex]AYQ37283.1 hydroxyacid dehydrogenase [Burkholderia lata]VWC85759.1 D-2-hydroxyacid dehydrogenase [Burkholderia aenigmatica]
MAHESTQRPELLMTGPYQPWDDTWLSAGYDVHRLWEAADRAAFIAEHGAGVRAIATRGDLGANAELIAALPKLEIIACYGVGTDAIDLAAARARGIRVTNTPDVLTGDVADLGVGLALAMMRRIGAGDAYVRSGAWRDGDMPLVTRLYGKRVGVVGFGRIGTTLARRLSGFDVELGYFDVAPREDSPHRFFGDLAALASWCDLLIVTLAGGPTTRHLVDAAVLDALGPQGYLVNVSRGTTVDEPALLDALERGAIAGAALDVFWNEPNIDPRFLALPNVLLQPHHASGTIETRQAMGWLVRDNLAAHFAGAPLVTPVA